MKSTNQSRKDKIDLLKGLLNGSTTIKDVNESKGILMLREYWQINEEPGIYYSNEGKPHTEAQIQAILATDIAKGVLPF
ncbi:MAG TPA: hypothetical protein VD794_11585, partial [Flavisolibacter sp.]|nr:hypothetical protein [Flavisolibacter sp.]